MTTKELWITIIVIGFFVCLLVGEIIDGILVGKSQERRQWHYKKMLREAMAIYMLVNCDVLSFEDYLSYITNDDNEKRELREMFPKGDNTDWAKEIHNGKRL